MRALTPCCALLAAACGDLEPSQIFAAARPDVLRRFSRAIDRHPQDRLADALHLASRCRIAQGGP